MSHISAPQLPLHSFPLGSNYINQEADFLFSFCTVYVYVYIYIYIYIYICTECVQIEVLTFCSRKELEHCVQDTFTLLL